MDDIGSVAETRQVVVSEMESVVVEQKVPQKHVYLVFESLRIHLLVLYQLFQQLESIEPNEDSFSL